MKCRKQGASDQAEQVLARSGRTFHLASRLLPARMRHDATLLYAFCRRMDDTADEGSMHDAEVLSEIVRMLRTEPRSARIAEAGWPTQLEERYKGMSAIAAVLTAALRDDAGPRQIATFAELHTYAYGVAGTVGLMMCRILGAPPAAAESASDLGIAMQFTNIARDVREDLERDRIYLPSAWIAPEAVRAAALGTAAAPWLEHVVLRLLREADHLYAAADRGMAFLPWRARIAILAAASCYREIGMVICRDPALSWRKRAVVSTPRKLLLVALACLRSVLYRRPKPDRGAPRCAPDASSEASI